jgi:hypothetical protein
MVCPYHHLYHNTIFILGIKDKPIKAFTIETNCGAGYGDAGEAGGYHKEKGRYIGSSAEAAFPSLYSSLIMNL